MAKTNKKTKTTKKTTKTETAKTTQDGDGRCQRISKRLVGQQGRVEKLLATVCKLQIKSKGTNQEKSFKEITKELTIAADQLQRAAIQLAAMPATLGATKRGKLVKGAKVAIKAQHQKRYADLIDEKDMGNFGLTIAKVNGSKFVLEMKVGKGTVKVLANRGHLEVEA